MVFLFFGFRFSMLSAVFFSGLGLCFFWKTLWGLGLPFFSGLGRCIFGKKRAAHFAGGSSHLGVQGFTFFRRSLWGLGFAFFLNKSLGFRVSIFREILSGLGFIFFFWKSRRGLGFIFFGKFYRV